MARPPHSSHTVRREDRSPTLGLDEEMSESDNERLFSLARDRKASFNGQPPGTVTFEQWVAVMLATASEASGEIEKPFFGLF